jgi:magnesium chelatase subunit D
VAERESETVTRGADIGLAAAIFAADPCGTGVVLRSGAGPSRDHWLALVRGLLPADVKVRRLPLHITDDRLLGGLDLAATLGAGRPISERGLLSEADNGVLLVLMAERISPALAARIVCAIDRKEVLLERDGLAERLSTRFGVIVFDEGIEDDERPPAALLDRLACHLDLNGIRPAEIDVLFRRDDVKRAPTFISTVRVGDSAIEALCASALALGIASANAPFLAVNVARAAAALDGSGFASERHLTAAARLVLAPRATMLPAPEGAEAPERPETEETQRSRPENEGSRQLTDVVLEAAKAAMPPGLLAQLLNGHTGPRHSHEPGRAGAAQSSTRRGRPAGVRRGPARGSARLDLIETLRAAVPWQRLRRPARHPGIGATAKRLEIRPDDFRIKRLKQKCGTVTIFVVDASGSTALARLAEAKGAVELLLADCYVRRDQVALIAFGGRGIELLLPPTRSLARAKRCLADLPGGGGTPLAAAIDAATTLARGIGRKGQAPAIVVLTDGRPNLARDGRPGRRGAEEDAIAAANGLRSSGFPALLIDTSAKADACAGRIAGAMGASYLPLPHADARALSQAVRMRLGEGE